MNKNNLLKKWLKRAKSLAIFLPDGPYGRPFDNIYYYHDLIEHGDGISLVLSDGITLQFLGNINVKEEKDKLIIRDFNRLEFIIDKKIDNTFYDGDVCLYRF